MLVTVRQLRPLARSEASDAMVFSYIDPGSGGMLIQILLAGVLAVPFFFRNAIAGVFRRVRGERSVTSEVAQDRTEDR